MEKTVNKGRLKVSILSLSLLTVMAGAAMAPALGVIREYFVNEKTLFVQLIISMPAVFIFLTSFVFPKLAARLRARTLLMIGLAFYTIGGCVAGVFSSIWLVLLMRALVGIGVGIIMPLSTGLLAFYFDPQEQEGLMGWSSAMNNMGGVIATLISGALATISWRVSFLVYLMGLISIVLCAAFMPNDKIQQEAAPQEKTRGGAEKAGTRPARKHSEPELGTAAIFKANYVYIIAMFLEMSAFFIYPANFAMVTARAGVIPENLTAIIMAMMDLVAFFGGMLFVKVKAAAGGHTKFVSPILLVVGYILLGVVGGWFGVIAGSICVGFANGEGIPLIISEASKKMGRLAGTTVMPLISAALYIAQFASPFITSGVTAIAGDAVNMPYYWGAVLSVLFLLWSALIPSYNVKNTKVK